MAEAGELIGASYRVDSRNSPRPGVLVTCRSADESAVGQDIAKALHNVTEFGVGLSVREVVRPNQLVEIGLRAPGRPEAIVRIGRVVWSDLIIGTVFRLGVVFSEGLRLADLEELCRLPGV